MRKHIALNGLALFSMLAAATAVADIQPGFYAGAAVGQATFKVDDVDFDAHDTAFKIFGGYNFNRNFAVELTYFNGGKPDQSFGTGSVEVSTDGLNVSALGRLPLGEVFSLFGKIGVASYDFEVKGRVGNSVIASETGHDRDLTYGIGAAFNLASSFELRAEYEAVDISGGDFGIVSVGGLYRF